MTFGEKVMAFYTALELSGETLPDNIEVMNPFNDPEVRKMNALFYERFFNDHRQRIFLIGINPGRFGGGKTGIPFTDPIHLETTLGIKNDQFKKHELSSRFVYDVVQAFGGPEEFFKHCYLTAVSPLGFVREGKNINYYDNKVLLQNYESQFVHWLKEQVSFGANRTVAFSLGRGKNYEYLRHLNKVHRLFDDIQALPHPRWVMQYRYPLRHEFAKEYHRQISKFLIS